MNELVASNGFGATTTSYVTLLCLLFYWRGKNVFILTCRMKGKSTSEEAAERKFYGKICLPPSMVSVIQF